tara:strand:+ start:1156 stop:3570 length:2415 start_codon:yes stop_codon:yes gene_type:complete
MKKQIAIFILAIFLMSIIPAAFAQEDVSTDAKKIRATNVNSVKAQQVAKAKQVIKPQLAKVEPRLKICVDFLKKNNLAENPTLKCNKLLIKEIKCVDFLKEKGINEPLAKCDRLFKTGGKVIKDRPYLAKAITNKVAEPRLKKIDRLVKKYPKATNFVKDLPEQKAKVFLHLPRAEQKKLLEIDATKAIKNLDKLKVKKVKKDMQFKKRAISLNKVRLAEKNFKLAKQEYVKANRIYKEKKALFLDVKEKLKACEGVESDECNELREKAKEHAKEFLINGAKMAIEHLNKIKNKVESAEDMDEDKAKEIITEIDTAISKLEDAITQVEAAQSKEDVQEAAKVINNIWKSIKHKEKLHAARLVHAKVWNIIKRSEHLEERLDSALTDMEEKGIDVDDIEAKVDEFSAKIAEAKEKYRKAEELLKQARDLKTENPDEEEITKVTELVKEAKQLLREAHNAAKEAHQILMDIVRSIKSAGGELTPQVESAEAGLDSDEVYEVVEGEEVEVSSEEQKLEEVAVPVSTEEDVSLEPVNLKEIEKPNCWADKPAYRPGHDKGYFIWQGKCANFIWVDWSGDTKDEWKKLRRCIKERRDVDIAEDATIEEIDDALEIADEIVDEASTEVSNAITSTAQFCEDLTLEEFKKLKRRLLYLVKGRITSNGRIFDVGTRKFDGADVLRFSDNIIKFKGRVGPHFDGLFFRTKGDVVLMELWFDGEKETRLINIGKNKRHPANNPFKMKVEPAKRPRVCSSGEIIYNEKCVKQIAAETVTSTGDEIIVSDDGSLSSNDFVSTTVESATGIVVEISS